MCRDFEIGPCCCWCRPDFGFEAKVSYTDDAITIDNHVFKARSLRSHQSQGSACTGPSDQFSLSGCHWPRPHQDALEGAGSRAQRNCIHDGHGDMHACPMTEPALLICSSGPIGPQSVLANKVSRSSLSPPAPSTPWRRVASTSRPPLPTKDGCFGARHFQARRGGPTCPNKGRCQEGGPHCPGSASLQLGPLARFTAPIVDRAS